MKKINVLILILLFAQNLYSGDDNFEISVGFNNFQMNSLKILNSELNQQASDNYKINTKIVDDYPPFWGYSLAYKSKVFKYFNFGAIVGLTSTGSRINYTDYSGSYSLDNKVHCLNYGLVLDVVANLDDNVDFNLGFEGGLLHSFLNTKESLTIGNESQSNQYDFDAASYYLNVNLKLYHQIHESFKIGFNLGFLIDFNDYYKLTTNNNRVLVFPSNNQLVWTDWTGIRSGLIFNYNY